MLSVVNAMLDEEVSRDRLVPAAEVFSDIEGEPESWRVLYPLARVLLLVVCATIFSSDDFDDVVALGLPHG